LLLNGYHIILIPRDPSKTKRFKISSFTARLIILGFMTIVPLLGGLFMLVMHYQNELVSSKREVGENLQILREKELISGRLASLERSMSKAEVSINSLEHSMDVELGEMKAGLGPLSQDFYLPGSGDEDESSDITETPHEALQKVIDLQGEENYKLAMNDISDRLVNINQRIDEIFELNGDKIRFMEANPYTMPVSGWVTSDFGIRKHPLSGSYKMHYGIDIASPVGTPVKAPANGTVVFADYRGGYGNMVVIDHGFGISTLYGHASQLFVKKGEKIKKGDPVAAIGSTGASTGPHLHYEIHVDGVPSDPMAFIAQ